MNDFVSESLQTPVVGSFDVVVAGAGPAGCAAAVSAARAGLSVALLERAVGVGGMFTEGLVTPLFDAENKTGFAAEVRDDMRAEGNFGGMWDICFQPEGVALLMERKLSEAGVRFFGSTYAARALVENGSIRGVIAENKKGRGAYLAKIVIDCTGDGDVCASAGVPFDYGDGAGNCQSCTLMFSVTGTEFKQSSPGELAELLNAAAKEHGVDYVCPFNNPYMIDLPGTDLRIVQLTHMKSEGLDPEKTAEAMAEGRRQVFDTLRVMRLIPVFRNIRLAQTASMLGVRESRRIRGKYTLTAEDAATGAVFEDGVTKAAFGIDIHPSAGGVQIVRQVVPYEIPLRSMLASGFDNLMMAGRCISGEHEVMASYRVTGDCLAMGDAAGVAAAESLARGISLDRLPIKQILTERYGGICR